MDANLAAFIVCLFSLATLVVEVRIFYPGLLTDYISKLFRLKGGY